MEDLDISNILSTEEIDTLFTDVDVEGSQDPETPEENDDKQETIEVDTDNLFDGPESVDSGLDDKGMEDAESGKDKASSQNKNFYSSIANALKDDGIFPDLDDETLSSIKEPEDFANAVEKQIQAKFDERQKRIDDALNAGVETSVIKQYENTLNYLDNIQANQIADESENGERLRKQLIYQDFINRGYSKERAEREIKKSFDAGSDIDDAKEALASNKEFFKSNYNKLVKDAQEEEQREVEERKQQAAALKKSILEDKKVFGELELDKATRQKVFDSISKPVYKDPETGELYTAIQKYEMENRTEFLKNLGLLYTLTEGFKNIDKLVKPRVQREIKKGVRELENKLNNTSRNSDGSLNFTSGADDSESFISKGWKLDI